MGLVMQLQVQLILLFFILCMLAFVLGSSGFGEPIAAKPYSFIPSTEAQQPVEHGLTTLVPTQQPHESSPPLSSLVQPPDRSFHPVAKPPHESAPVVAETPHYPTLPPVTETARSPLGSPPPPEVLYPEPPVETPPLLPVPPPHESPQKAPTVQLSPVSLPVLSPPSKVSSPAASVPPSLVLPFPLEPQPPSSSPPPTANPPQILTPKAPVEAPPLFTTPPPYESPLPVLSPSSEIPPLQVSPPTASVISNASAPPPLELPPPQAGDTPHVKLSPPLAVSPSYAPSLLPTAKPPHPSSLPLAANPPLLPVAQPPAALTFVPPPKSQPLNESSLPPQSLPSTALSPPEFVPPTALSPPPQSAPINASSPPISSTRPSPVFDSPPSLPPLPTPKPPHPSSLPLAANPPLLPVAQPPAALTFVPPPKSQPLNESSLPPQSLPSTALSPPESVPPTALSPPPQSAPINASSPPISSTRPSPVFDSPPSVPPLPTAKPPHRSSLPLAANPPLLPVAQPPVALTFVPPPKSQPLNESSLPPQSLPSTALSPPESVPPTALSPPPQSAPINASSPPISSTQPSPVFDSPPSVPPLPTAKPPHPSSLPLAANPPLLPVAQPPAALTLVPPPESQPLDKPSLPPQSPPSTALSPPESVPPTASSPPPQSAPINASSPPSSSTQPSPVFNSPPSLPPLPSPSIVSSPPPQVIPPIALTLPPLQNASSPVPSLIPHISPPTQPLPPSSSVSIPSMAPPLVNLPPDLPAPPPSTPQNASSPPPQSTPVNASSPVFPPIPRLLPPISSFSPPLTVPPPMGSAPDLLEPPPPVPQNPSSPPPEFFAPPPATPSTPVPQNASSPLPQTAPLHASPPPQLILPPPASSPTSTLPSSPVVSPPTVLPATSSPPMPSHAVSPLPHLIPPPSFSPPVAEPPQVLSAPPPSKLPGAIPPRAPSPPLFLSPPRAPPPQEKGLHASVSPPPKVPPHTSSAPPPSELSHPSTPPPGVNSTVHALPPHSSQRKVSQGGAPPPLLTSPETSPPPGTSSRASPPFEQVKPESPPPIRQPVEAPKQSASSSRFNASAPSTKPDLGTASPPAPRDRAPEHLSPHKSPHHEPKFDLQNGTAPAPLSSQVIPAVNGSHHSWHHSPGAPKATAPLPSPQGIHKISSAASPIPHAPPPVDSEIPFLTPKVSPTGSTPKNTKKPQSTPLRSLPPPPPNADCGYLTCPEPTTNTPPGAPCGCVWPMQVGMRLSVALYTFFPLVSELAQEIANGEFLKPSQVRIMGGNASIQEPEKTIVLIDLVPLDDKFDNITSHLISDRFWHKQVFIDKSIFGDYDILYVRYPGLPPSPPMAPADAAVINGMPYSYGDPTGNKLHPLGVDVTKQGHKRKPNAIIIAVIVLSAVLGVLMCSSLAWLLVSRRTNSRDQPSVTPRAVTSLARSSGPTGLSTGSGHSSPMSLGSSLATYTGSAKTFSGTEIEKATDNFNPSRILGEGGFGLVYSGDLDDNTKIAVKVLKRDDQQGGREFLAEVEMLSRLHHRNLVKLIGICTDERMRCLVYELIPNGSVDSHLHGTDKDIAPLDWASRVKIALGAARGLAYLHEDSSPRVIHRDFKSSNILLENDFTPKVSDFGLARTALDEQNKHISTRVMGTFGYVAPEYAMTGHLLVKSDVYSYGVVLLELLTGRKPVDMSQPAGQENLVAWTKPLLTSKEGLESIIDPSLGSEAPFESVAKVAAIASMCVQPEVSHRPFMGEVVQALKLVCNECDDSKDGGSRSRSHENLSGDFDAKDSSPVARPHDPLPGEFSLPNYAARNDVEKGLSVSEIFGASATLGRQASDSFRRHSASGPLRTPKGRQFWQRMRKQSHESESEHGIMYRLWAGSH